MSNQLVCMCNMVTDDEIEMELEKGASATETIQEETRAGTSCGRCLVQIDEMVRVHNEKNSSEEDTQDQGTLNF